MDLNINRRRLLQAASVGSVCLGMKAGFAQEGTRPLPIKKTLKIGMINDGQNLIDKFQIAKDAGYDGVEMDSPGYETVEILKAIQATGLPVDGTVCSTHWNIRHTDPDANVRAHALRDLKFAIEQTHAIGGHTTLLVIGHGKDGDIQELHDRSKPNIEKAIPLAAELGVVIAIENVWNHYLYDHNGKPEQTADAFAEYVDYFQSPWVGMQFDIGNHWKYGNPGAWIRTLGKRIVKLDIKGFSRIEDKFTAITECDLPWNDVREALREIRFTGWCAAELPGTDAAGLEKIAQEMNEVLDLG